MNRGTFISLLAALAAAISAPAPAGAAAAAEAPKGLIARWSFDGATAGNTIAEASGKPGWDIRSAAAVPRMRGVFGEALELRGSHALRTDLHLPPEGMAALTLCVWARPSAFERYNEIFRQECSRRVLFSFQEGGTILSLGLDIGGYVECDAPLQPAQVLDDAWHHCAASFDGRAMRVYLDGREIGSLERPGRIAIQRGVPAFVGSSGGTGEHFQGGLDDLRLYETALSAAEIAELHRQGAEALQARLALIEPAVDAFYRPANSFAQVLGRCRERLGRTNQEHTAEMASLVRARLKRDFPRECEEWSSRAGVRLSDYLLNPEPGLNARLAGRLMDLLLEYRPLTEAQWRAQSPEDYQRWREADGLQERCARLAAKGEQGSFAPEWIEVILAAGSRIQMRPREHEAVAPYVKPETPATRALSTAEARQALEKDWLHQADQRPTPARVRSEIQWTRELAARLGKSLRQEGVFRKELAELDAIERSLETVRGEEARPSYFRTRELKRAILFRNPAVDFDKLLLVDMPYPQGSEWPHETRHRLGYMAVPGGRLLVVEGLGPEGRPRQLMPQAPLHGSFWRPDLSYDADKVLFCFKPHNEKSFHLYEIDVDGTGLRQLTHGPYDDLDPIYLPDDRNVIFSTTRSHTYVRCMPPTSAFVLARVRRDGSGIYFVSVNNEPDYTPSVMNDGRILHTRWEYTDKPLWRAQKLWTVNPDGTQVSMFWGNQSVWPDLMKDARSIPGSRRVMFTGSAHHDWFSGSVGIVDPDRGLNFPHGLAKVTADVPWPECGNGPVDPVESPAYHASGAYRAYYSPYPLSETDFLVSANRNGRFVLYLMDTQGNRELVYEGAHHVLHAQPLRPRPRPPVIEDRVDWPSREERDRPRDGVLFSSSVYQGASPELRGQARYLRVFSIDHKTYTYWYKRPYISTGPVVSAVQSEGVKRLLGTVPIRADGSVSFHAPAGVPLHFQLLDERQRALQTMRSFVGVMPGEYRGCQGCHEAHSRASESSRGLALTREPERIAPPPWGEDTVSYPRYVQAVLDRYCGKCHQGEGEARKVLDLTERPSQPVFTEPYLTLIGRPSWGEPYRPPEKPAPGFGIAGCLLVEGYGTVDPKAYVTPPPMTALSYRSRLVEIASSGKHHDVKVDPESLLRLIVWVDAMCPYMGDEEIRRIPDPVFQGVDWLAVRPRIATAPRIARPGPVD